MIKSDLQCSCKRLTAVGRSSRDVHHCFVLELLNLSFDLVDVVLSFAVVLGLYKLETFWTLAEPGQQKGQEWMGEEPFLGFFAVLVHRVSN